MIVLTIAGVEVRAVPDPDNWVGLRFVVVCEHCKGRRFHRDDRRPEAEVVAGHYAVEPFAGRLSVGAALAVLAHVAFVHSTLPVLPVEWPPPAPAPAPLATFLRPPPYNPN